MKSNFKFYFFSSIISMVLTSYAAHAEPDTTCDEVVGHLQTQHLGGMSLCDLQIRYKIAIERLKRSGIENPLQIGNVIGPRFINMSDWTKYLAKNGDSEFTAWKVYKPSPRTWGNWMKASAIIDDEKTENVFMGKNIKDIQTWILALHAMALHKLYAVPNGQYRADVEEIIPLHSVEDAYPVKDILAIANTPYFSEKHQKKLMNFVPRLCNERQSQVPVPKAEAGAVPEAFQFKHNPGDVSEPAKSCGDLTMAIADEVVEQMDRWTEYMKSQFRNLSLNPESVDVVAFAATAQQWFVIIHPFIDGNGRTSRLMMDFILRKAGLPTPVLDDQNRDFFTTKEEWADLVGRGMINTVRALEACVENPSAAGCKVVSSAPPQQ